MLLKRKGKRDLRVIERIAGVEKPINQLAENSASFLSGISGIFSP
jgi:hypothetical protein